MLGLCFYLSGWISRRARERESKVSKEHCWIEWQFNMYLGGRHVAWWIYDVLRLVDFAWAGFERAHP